VPQVGGDEGHLDADLHPLAEGPECARACALE
jgi:hypothetical protein